MLDGKTLEVRARMACRIYLTLFDAGQFGAPLRPSAALGRRDSSVEFGDIARQLIRDFLDLDIFTREMVLNDEQYYALTAEMRRRMGDRGADPETPADRIRHDLWLYDYRKDVPASNFGRHEIHARKGDSSAAHF